ncbi:hypothetical protein GCM10027403_14610 [Arthrobacter tecti]
MNAVVPDAATDAFGMTPEAWERLRKALNNFSLLLDAQTSALRHRLRDSGFLEDLSRLAGQLAPIASAAEKVITAPQFDASVNALYEALRKDVLCQLPAIAPRLEFPNFATVYRVGEAVRDDAGIVAGLPTDEELGPDVAARLENINRALAASGYLAADCADIGVRFLWRIVWIAVTLYLAGNFPVAILVLQSAGFEPDTLDDWARSLSSRHDEQQDSD